MAKMIMANAKMGPRVLSAVTVVALLRGRERLGSILNLS